MPAPKFDEPDSDEEDPGQRALDAAKAILAKSRDVGEKHGAAILAVLVLFGVLYFWLAVIPKPVTVTVSATEVDTGAPVTGAQVFADYIAPPYIFTSAKKTYAIPLSDGEYAFRNVPSNTEGIVFEVTKSGDYENYRGDFGTGPGSGTVAAKLFKKTQLRIESAAVFGSIGPSCKKAFNVPVSNNDTENDLEAVLVATGLPYFVSDRTTIAAGETANVSFSIMTNYPDSDKNPQFLTGDVRISGTQKKAIVNVTLTRQPELKLDLTQIDKKIGETVLAKISNNGKGRITGIRLLMDDSSRTLIELSGLRENEAFDLEPGRSKSVYATAKAEGLGIITVTADCTAPLELPVKISTK